MKKCFTSVLVFAILACFAAGCAPKPKPAETPDESAAATVPQPAPPTAEKPAPPESPAPAEGPAPAAERPERKAPFEVALYATDTFYRIDHPMEVTLILKNTSRETIALDKGINFLGGFVINGNAKVLSQKGRDAVFEQPIAIPPSGFIGRRINLAAYFDEFKQPGHYTVYWSDPELGKSDSIEMEVTTYAMVMTDLGDIDICLLPKVAPDAVAQFKRLANDGFYDNSVISGIKANSMVAISPSEKNLEEYAGKYAPLKQETPTEVITMGDVVVARQLDIQMLDKNPPQPEREEFLNSGSPSFFVQLVPGTPSGITYTVFGKVFRGLDVLYNISRARQARGSQGLTLARPAEEIRVSRVIIVDEAPPSGGNPNIAPPASAPEAEISVSPQEKAFTYGEPIDLLLTLKNPYDSSLELPSLGLKNGLKINRVEEKPGEEAERVQEALSPDFPEIFLPVSRGLLGPGEQIGLHVDIANICPAFASGGKFEIAWEAGGVKTKTLTIAIQKALFANITTSKGAFQAILFPETAPLAVGRFRQLAQEGYYNDLPVYKVINTPALSLAQSGSKTGDETGKANLPDIPLEPSDRLFNVGTIGFSRTGANPDSGNSQYFIVTQLRADGAAALHQRYTIIGEIISARDEKGNPADFRTLLAKLAKDDKVVKIEISEKKTR